MDSFSSSSQFPPNLFSISRNKEQDEVDNAALSYELHS